MQQEARADHSSPVRSGADYVLAYVLLGPGFMLTSPVAPVHRSVGVVVLACGAVIFVAAVSYSLRGTLSLRRQHADW